jgi:hypothetical protein
MKRVRGFLWRFGLALALLLPLYNAVYRPSEHKGLVALGWFGVAAMVAAATTVIGERWEWR